MPVLVCYWHIGYDALPVVDYCFVVGLVFGIAR